MPKMESMKEVKCPYMNPDQVRCYLARCGICGWNPKVAQARQRKMLEKKGGGNRGKEA